MALNHWIVNIFAVCAYHIDRLLNELIENLRHKLVMVEAGIDELYANYERFTIRVTNLLLDEPEGEIDFDPPPPEEEFNQEDFYEIMDSAFLVQSVYTVNDGDEDIIYPAVGDLVIWSSGQYEDDDDEYNIIYPIV